MNLPAFLAPASAPAAAPAPRRGLWRRGVAALLCVSLLSPLGAPITSPVVRAQSNLPALGDTASEEFSLGTERSVGEQIMREIRRDPDYLDDAVLTEYLESLWQPLVQAARQRGEINADLERFAWEPFLIRDRNVNAFALPGGHVGVYLGLFAMTATRDELASVLAHELSHVTQRHIARSFASSKTSSLIGAAALILGVLAASRGSGNADAANALITGGQAAAIQGQLNFSRDMEREADRIGFGVMTTAGFAPGGMAAMFEKLDQSSRLNDSGGYPYLRSHPLTTERIGEARSRLGAAPPVPPVSVLEHSAAQARARVLMDVRVDALRRWQALDGDTSAVTTSEKLMAAYESALASSLLRDWPRADASLRKAAELARRDARAERAVTLLTAQSTLDRGDAARALVLLKPYDTGGTTRPVMLLQARAGIALTGDDDAPLRGSAEVLQTWVAAHPVDADAWGVLSQVWGRLGQRLRALRAEAESRYALGDMTGAVDRLRAGQRLSRTAAGGDFIEASVIDSRLRDIEAKRKQLAAEERAHGG